MMNKFFIASTALLAAVSALPSANSDEPTEGKPPKNFPPKNFPPKTWHKLDQTAEFDNAEGLSGVSISPIGIYGNIFWQGMSLVETTEASKLSGIVVNSPPKCAAYSKLDVVTLKQGQPSMMTNYPDSNIHHLDLHSFYYGCALGSQETILGIPLSCTVSIEGYADDERKKLVAKQNFEFKRDGLSTQMSKAVVDHRFKGLKRVDFFVTNDVLVAGLIDTVKYTVYSEKKDYD